MAAIGVLVHHRRPVRVLERHVGHADAVVARRRAGGHALRARPAPASVIERDVALAHGDGLRGVGDVDDVGRAAGLRGVDVPELQPHVVGHREAAEARRVARAEVAVDVLRG
jgi:hypothetical protein